MPMADTLGDLWGKPTRTLAYGRDKSKKTWWACRAAEAGFNVVLIDGDDGSSITRQLPLEARKKILIVDAVDKSEHAAFCMFMASFLKVGNKFLWDEQDKFSVPFGTKLNPVHSYIQFDPSLLTMDDVIILDSWTALADSTKQKFAKDTGFDLVQVQRDGDQYALPNFQARFLDFVLSRLHTLPCHVIVIGHEQIWEKYTGTGAARKLVGTYTQPYSSTGPHAQKLGKHFENVLHFYKLSDAAFRISTVGDDSVSAGSRLIAPKRYEWDAITPGQMFEAVGSKASGAPCIGAKFIDKGELLSIPAPVENTQQNTSVPGPAVLNGSNVSLSEKLKLLKKG